MMLLAYKVMATNPENSLLVSGADNRLTFPATLGRFSMPSPGIWLSTNRNHVLDYYSVHDHNALLTVEIDPKTVSRGSLDDLDTEFCVPHANIISLDFFTEDAP